MLPLVLPGKLLAISAQVWSLCSFRAMMRASSLTDWLVVVVV